MHVLRDVQPQGDAAGAPRRARPRSVRVAAEARRAQAPGAPAGIARRDRHAVALKEMLDSNPTLQTVHEFRERLQQLWSGANASNDRLLAATQGLVRPGRSEWRQGAAGLRDVTARLRAATRLAAEAIFARLERRKPADWRVFCFRRRGFAGAYLIFDSLYLTCLRTTGSNFMISSLSGCRRLFFVVV